MQDEHIDWHADEAGHIHAEDGAGFLAEIIPFQGYEPCTVRMPAEARRTECGAPGIVALGPFQVCADHLDHAGEMAADWLAFGQPAADDPRFTF